MSTQQSSPPDPFEADRAEADAYRTINPVDWDGTARRSYSLAVSPWILGIGARAVFAFGCWFVGLVLAFADLDSKDMTVSDVAATAVSAPVLVWMAVLLLTMPVGELVHELGHAVVGRLCGARGPRITATVDGAETSFREWPPTRQGLACTLAAGPVAHFGYAALLADVALQTNPGGLILNPLAVGAGLAALIAVWNLVPHAGSDGAKLLILHRGQPLEMQPRLDRAA